MKLKNRTFAALAALSLALAAAACESTPEDEGEPEDTGGPTAAAPPPAGSDDITLAVTSPTDGETVTVPFEVVMDASVPFGPVDVEDHHAHIWFGDMNSAPNIVFSDTVMIDGVEIQVPDGETTLIAQVHTSEHEPAGEPVEVALTVEGGSAGGGDDDNGGSDY